MKKQPFRVLPAGQKLIVLVLAAMTGFTLGLAKPSFVEASVLAFATNPNNQVGVAEQLLDLTGTGVFALGFEGSGRFLIIFSAECANDAPDQVTWTDIDIEVDGVGVSPSDQIFDAFCTSNGTAGSDGWVRASMQVVIAGLAEGSHSVSVRVRSSNPASGGWWIGDISITVVN